MTRIEHMSSPYYPVATAKRTFRSSRAGERPLFAERALRNVRAYPASVRLDVEGPDHLAPLLGFVGDELAKVGGRTDKRRGSHVGNARLHFGVGKGSVDLFVELVDDIGGCVRGSAEAIPCARLIARHEIAHGRDIRQYVQASRRRYREREQPARPDVLDGGRHCRKAYQYFRSP